MKTPSPLPEDQGPTFDPSTHYCARHLEPFRADWPRGWPMAMMGIFQECLRRPDIIAATGGDTKMLDRVMREFSPVCCLVGDETTARWAALALGPHDAYHAAYDAILARKDS